MSRILVIPSNREQCLREFLTAWEGRGGWDKVVLIEDGPERTFDVRVDYHFSHKEIGEILGPDAWIISRRDSACRCFGFLAAWHLGASHVLTLDDDVRPHGNHGNLFDEHLENLEHFPRWVSTWPGLRVRGLPYVNQGERRDVALSCGLWSGVPDLDGRTQLQWTPPLDFAPPPGRRLLARGEYAPLSGMNLCVARRALPLLYYPLMGEGSPYARFDDIWGGIIAKKLCDHLGWQVSVGEPFVRHERASDPHVNATKEAPGIEANERFWETVDRISLDDNETRPHVHVQDMGYHLRENIDPYISRLGEALQVWSGLFTESARGRFAAVM